MPRDDQLGVVGPAAGAVAAGGEGAAVTETGRRAAAAVTGEAVAADTAEATVAAEEVTEGRGGADVSTSVLFPPVEKYKNYRRQCRHLKN